MNPWHDVPLGDDPEQVFQCIIEIPRGSKNKYEIDKETGLLRLDRVLYSAVHYPASYGFLPRTYCDDGDPLDVLVVCQAPIQPMCIVEARPIGVIGMSDDMGQDDKIIAVPLHDPEYTHVRDAADLGPHRQLEIRQFMLDYKRLENKEVDVDEMKDAKAARAVIRDAIKLYEETFGK
ncbi:MAG: inorganic diphosphatase [Planctomycetota bacterium]|jgi:inorganic pyrophosphatase